MRHDTLPIPTQWQECWVRRGFRDVCLRIDAGLDDAARAGRLRPDVRFCVSTTSGFYCTLSHHPEHWGDVSVLLEQVLHDKLYFYDWLDFPRTFRRRLAREPSQPAQDIANALNAQLRLPKRVRQHDPPSVAGADAETMARIAIEAKLERCGGGVDSLIRGSLVLATDDFDCFDVSEWSSAAAARWRWREPLRRHVNMWRYVWWKRHTSGDHETDTDECGWNPLADVTRKALNTLVSRGCSRTLSAPMLRRDEPP